MGRGKKRYWLYHLQPEISTGLQETSAKIECLQAQRPAVYGKLPPGTAEDTNELQMSLRRSRHIFQPASIPPCLHITTHQTLNEIQMGAPRDGIDVSSHCRGSQGPNTAQLHNRLSTGQFSTEILMWSVALCDFMADQCAVLPFCRDSTAKKEHGIHPFPNADP